MEISINVCVCVCECVAAAGSRRRVVVKICMWVWPRIENCAPIQLTTRVHWAFSTDKRSNIHHKKPRQEQSALYLCSASFMFMKRTCVCACAVSEWTKQYNIIIGSVCMCVHSMRYSYSYGTYVYTFDNVWLKPEQTTIPAIFHCAPLYNANRFHTNTEQFRLMQTHPHINTLFMPLNIISNQ